MRNKNKLVKLIKLLWHWIAPWILMLIVSLFILPIFGYKFDLRKTIRLQAEKVGLGFKDTKPAVLLMQEYPAVEGISYRDSINLAVNPALMIWRENEQAFWVGIQSQRESKNYNNPILFLNFNGKADVRVDSNNSVGWIETDPDFTYFIKLNGGIQPMTGIRINPLFIRFPEEGIYFVQYTITGDDEIPTQGVFPVKVHKKIVVKKIEKQKQ